MRISDWSSDVCSSDLCPGNPARGGVGRLSAPMAVPPDAGAALWSGTLRGANMTAAPEIRGRQKFLFAETQLRDQCLIATLVLLLEIGEEGDRKSTRLNSSH